MQDKKLTKNQLKIIEKAELYIEKFEKINKMLQMPWRKCLDDYKNDANNIIKNLNELLINIKSEFINDIDANIIISVVEMKEKLILYELRNQNLQKQCGDEVTPFGEMDFN